MSDVLRKVLGELSAIVAESSPKKRRKLLAQAAQREDILKAITELSRNTIKGNLPLNQESKKQLSKRRKDVQCLMKCSELNCCVNKKATKIVAQSGGWLQFIAPAAIGFVLDQLTK